MDLLQHLLLSLKLVITETEGIKAPVSVTSRGKTGPQQNRKKGSWPHTIPGM